MSQFLPQLAPVCTFKLSLLEHKAPNSYLLWSRSWHFSGREALQKQSIKSKQVISWKLEDDLMDYRDPRSRQASDRKMLNDELCIRAWDNRQLHSFVCGRGRETKRIMNSNKSNVRTLATWVSILCLPATWTGLAHVTLPVCGTCQSWRCFDSLQVAPLCRGTSKVPWSYSPCHASVPHQNISKRDCHFELSKFYVNSVWIVETFFFSWTHARAWVRMKEPLLVRQ